MAYPEATWSSGTTYAINDLANYQGMDYISLANSNLANIPPATVGASWDPYTTWLVGTTYAINNIVVFGGYKWTSLKNSNIGNSPASGTWWSFSGSYQSRSGEVYIVIPWEVSGIFGRSGTIRRESYVPLVIPWEVSGIFGRPMWGRSNVAHLTSSTDFRPFSYLQASSVVVPAVDRIDRAGLSSGRIAWGYSVPQFVVTPDGLVILIGAPFTAKLGVPT